ncbi:MAG: hypothetical protein PHR35_08555, partial [Kiritimatiellae bacterium]|nr:hypothetical protein [Kiritimatiellia bacterium]
YLVRIACVGISQPGVSVYVTGRQVRIADAAGDSETLSLAGPRRKRRILESLEDGGTVAGAGLSMVVQVPDDGEREWVVIWGATTEDAGVRGWRCRPSVGNGAEVETWERLKVWRQWVHDWRSTMETIQVKLKLARGLVDGATVTFKAEGRAAEGQA